MNDISTHLLPPPTLCLGETRGNFVDSLGLAVRSLLRCLSADHQTSLANLNPHQLRDMNLGEGDHIHLTGRWETDRYEQIKAMHPWIAPL